MRLWVRSAWLVCCVALSTLVVGACDNSAARPRGVPLLGMTGSSANGEDDADAGQGDGRHDAADGEACERDGDCESNHCRNGLCCAGGECCRSVEDCGDGSGFARDCDHPDRCQGSRSELACDEHRCVARTRKDDDRACSAGVQANPCGPYRPVFCTGEREQQTPQCPSSCSDDADCDDTAQCTDEVCVDRRLPPGEACEDDSQCASGVCSDGACCRDRVSCPDRPDERDSSEEDQLRCLDVFTPGIIGNDCRACACERCAPAMLDCYASGDDRRDALCGAVPLCVYFANCGGDCSDETYGCYGELCFCGIGNPGCELPYGPCVEPIVAAGGTRDPVQLRERAASSESALYYAHAYSQCLFEQCPSACTF